MKAVICTGYGPPEVLQVRSAPDPRPKRNEVCIRQAATSVTASDCIVRGLKLRGRYRLFMRVAFGFRAPRRGIIGMIASGRIESAGRDVKAFKEGDEVFGMDGFRAGAYAEKVCWPATTELTLKPANLTFEEAAALPYGGLLASFFMRKLQVGPGKRVLVYGASGAIGTASVQLARHLGAEVTGVCSTANLELVRSLGAASVIDYTQDDFTQKGDRYDVIFDAVGRRKSAQAMATSAAALAPRGLAMSVDDAFPRTKAADLVALKALAESGEFRPVIDRVFPLDEIVEAHRYVDLGHKKGNVVVSV
ncbi:MAG TPA: NAD(P)-dependent alcohol dehydrogenase [Candidatus Dormibacteraeota bacterium]|nr:NAD(P)-dependent alcohol dehydrogenase [Candidatus Dormibacteraeota bacterium]